jgi:hypothetical protein
MPVVGGAQHLHQRKESHSETACYLLKVTQPELLLEFSGQMPGRPSANVLHCGVKAVWALSGGSRVRTRLIFHEVLAAGEAQPYLRREPRFPLLFPSCDLTPG